MSTATRIYRVQDGDAVRLISATNPAQALRFLAGQRYQIRPASAIDVADLMTRGTKVEAATADAAESPAEVAA